MRTQTISRARPATPIEWLMTLPEPLKEQFMAEAWQVASERVESEKRQQAIATIPLVDFACMTRIETPQENAAIGSTAPSVPLELWPAQRDILALAETERLLILLKARQLGISWILSCLFPLWLCVTQPGRTVLEFSKGLGDANELIRRIVFLYVNHALRSDLPKLVTENTSELGWANGSRIMSLAATRTAGRSFAASLVILEEFAFMQWPKETYDAVKPTIDNGGKLFIVSSADGQGTTFHRHWLASESGESGFRGVFLPWQANPMRGPNWRALRIRESVDGAAAVIREYPENANEAFVHAAGLVYDVWSDGPEDGNVQEQADYIPDAGPVYWACDDGYAGHKDPLTGYFTAESHPRVFLFVQERADGRLCVFNESYVCGAVEEAHIAGAMCMPYRYDDVRAKVQSLGKSVERDPFEIIQEARASNLLDFYPMPSYAVVDKSAASLRGRLSKMGIATAGSHGTVEESIKIMRQFVAKDNNGWRRLWVHPRCKNLRYEMSAYKYKEDGVTPVKQNDNGNDACRYHCFAKRG